MIRALFGVIADHPRLVLVLAFGVAAVFATPLLRVRFDYRPDAFIPEGHPALEAKQAVEREFGLRDPMMLALMTGERDGIFHPGPMTLIRDLTLSIRDGLERLAAAGEIAPLGDHPIYSLATEKSVALEGDIPQEFPFLEPFPATPEDFAALRKAIQDIELYTGVIVSEDGSAAAIVIMPPLDHADPVYELVEGIAREARPRLAAGQMLHLAGEAGVRSAMGKAVARDGLRFNPICFAVITVFLYLAFRSLAGVLIPIFVVGCSILLMLGSMVLAGKPFYIITSAIPVTVMSIGVASSMHLIAEFYDRLRQAPPGASKRDMVVDACRRLWAPLLFTAATDVVGFASTFLSGIMPPLEWFGLFSALGLGMSLLFAWTIVPACLMLVDTSHRKHLRLRDWATAGPIAVTLRRLGLWCHDHAGIALLGGVLAVVVGAFGAVRVRPNQSMESAFRQESPVVQASRAINLYFHGTYFLDVLLEGEEPGDIIRPEVLGKIEELEAHAKALPHAGGSLSIAGFVKKVHQILARGDPAEYRIPDTAATIRDDLALIRSQSPTKLADLRRMVTDDYRRANVRIRLKSGEFVHESVVVEDMERFLRGHFAGLPVRASLAGRVNMDYHWMKLVLRSNVGNVALAMALVYVCMAVGFRSLIGGLFCLAPVGIAVLYTYAVMGFAGIDLGIGTSMFAAIATGVGVDYPTHLLERLRRNIAEEGLGPRQAFAETAGIAGKAVLFNAAAVSFGFLVLVVSELPILVHFGAMIAVGIAAAAASSLTVLFAMVKWFRPRFVYGKRR